MRRLSTSQTPPPAGLIKRAEARPGGTVELLKVAVPLILATGSHSIQFFVDRLLLSRFSEETIAAAAPAGMACWTALCLFIGIVGYAGTFVSQYHGARRLDRIGPSVWQGIYIALASYALILPLWFLGPHLFRWAGHPVNVQPHEVVYFRILIRGAIFPLLSIALSVFFSGRGRTVAVMMVTVLVTAVNIVLDSILIFGRFGFPSMGIAGAGCATVIANAVGCIVYAVLFLSRRNRAAFGTLRGSRPDPALMKRLLRFGAPYGFQMLIDMGSWTFWAFLLGSLGTIELATSNIVFSIQMLAFMPAVGVGGAAQILVGRHLGADRDRYAARTARRAAALSVLVMTSITLSYVYVPRTLLGFFRTQAQVASFAPIETLGVALLRFVAVYSIFDAVLIVYASVLRGAGDTRFTMIAFLVLSSTVLALPTFLAVKVFNRGIFTIWSILAVYVVIATAVFALRYRHGRWRSMRVIERQPVDTCP